MVAPLYNMVRLNQDDKPKNFQTPTDQVSGNSKVLNRIYMGIKALNERYRLLLTKKSEQHEIKTAKSKTEKVHWRVIHFWEQQMLCSAIEEEYKL